MVVADLVCWCFIGLCRKLLILLCNYVRTQKLEHQEKVLTILTNLVDDTK